MLPRLLLVRKYISQLKGQPDFWDVRQRVAKIEDQQLVLKLCPIWLVGIVPSAPLAKDMYVSARAMQGTNGLIR